jgi:hypothetical protein
MFAEYFVELRFEQLVAEYFEDSEPSTTIGALPERSPAVTVTSLLVVAWENQTTEA